MSRWDLEPSVGRVVHYVYKSILPNEDQNPRCHAAMVTGVNGANVSLTILPPGIGVYYRKDVPHDETLQETEGFQDHVPDTWHWPEMVNTGFSMKVITDGNPPARPE